MQSTITYKFSACKLQLAYNVNLKFSITQAR